MIFIWEGMALITSGGETGRLAHDGAVLLETDETYAVEHVGTDVLKLIRCRASAQRFRRSICGEVGPHAADWIPAFVDALQVVNGVRDWPNLLPPGDRTT